MTGAGCGSDAPLDGLRLLRRGLESLGRRGAGVGIPGAPSLSGPRKPCGQKPCWQIYAHGLHGYVGASAGLHHLECVNMDSVVSANMVSILPSLSSAMFIINIGVIVNNSCINIIMLIIMIIVLQCVCVCTHMCIHMYVCIYIYIYIYTHTYTYTYIATRPVPRLSLSPRDVLLAVVPFIPGHYTIM